LFFEYLICRGTPFTSQINPNHDIVFKMYQVISISHQKKPCRDAVS